jgi:hypothetical protein
VRDVYPTEEELNTIEKWDLIECDKGTYKKLYELIDYVKELWNYEDRFRVGKLHKDRLFKDRKIRTIYMSTGGWSGNEEIICALEKNLIFWMMYWHKSQRGGHYWFEIPPLKVKLKDGQ